MEYYTHYIWVLKVMWPPGARAFSRLPTICAYACARARMALALGKLNFSCAVIGLTCMPTKPEPLNLVVPVVNFPRANAILARAQALLWVRDWPSQWQKREKPWERGWKNILLSGTENFENQVCQIELAKNAFPKYMQLYIMGYYIKLLPLSKALTPHHFSNGPSL
jgi:hypothetical protein